MARPRRSQAREDAKGEFVEAAWELFSRRGYDATPVSAIIEKVGLSKGSFYYYFTSKEEVLDAVVSRIVDEISRAVEPIPSHPEFTTQEKMRSFFRAIGDWKVANMDIIREAAEVIYRDENVIIRHKMNNMVVERLSPALAEIVARGIEEGAIDAEEAEGTAEMILRFFNAMAEMQAASFVAAKDDPAALMRVIRKAELYMAAIEKMLGVSRGVLSPLDADFEERLQGAVSGEGMPREPGLSGERG